MSLIFLTPFSLTESLGRTGSTRVMLRFDLCTSKNLYSELKNKENYICDLLNREVERLPSVLGRGSMKRGM
jgi:hypothetical protein